jgi:uncharacterized protein (TIGR02145 family)
MNSKTRFIKPKPPIMTKVMYLSLSAILLAAACKKSDNDTIGTFTDSRDGQSYTFKQIGSQVWMTENLNYAATGSRCYDNDPLLCVTFGRLYDLNTALTVAPAGWHLPSDAEWTLLTTFLGGESIAGDKMKATTLWSGTTTGGSNSSGFTALPGGFSQDTNVYDYKGFSGGWWSSTDFDPGNAWARVIKAVPTAAIFRQYAPKHLGFSVRCVKN